MILETNVIDRDYNKILSSYQELKLKLKSENISFLLDGVIMELMAIKIKLDTGDNVLRDYCGQSDYAQKLIKDINEGLEMGAID